MAIEKNLVNEIVKRVLMVTRPERVILFGSAADGGMGPDSDVDLLVLENDPGDRIKKSAKISDALRGMGIPFDVIVMATERFEESKDIIGGRHPWLAKKIEFNSENVSVLGWSIGYQLFVSTPLLRVVLLEPPRCWRITWRLLLLPKVQYIFADRCEREIPVLEKRQDLLGRGGEGRLRTSDLYQTLTNKL